MPDIHTYKNYLSRYPVITSAMGIASALIFFTSGSGDVFQYDRNAIGAGEFWRLFTGHLAHWNFDHFFWCALVFLGLGSVCEQFNKKGFVSALVLSGLVSPVATWVLMPDMAAYRGLSGLGSGIFMFGCVWLLQDCFKKKHWQLFSFAGLAALVFTGKIFFEYCRESTLIVHSGDLFSPVPLVHLAGGICGIVSALLFRPRVENNQH